MKGFYLLSVCILIYLSSQGQILITDNNGDTTLEPSAALEVKSTSKGLLPPRMTTMEQKMIPEPVAGGSFSIIGTGYRPCSRSDLVPPVQSVYTLGLERVYGRGANVFAEVAGRPSLVSLGTVLE